MLVCQTCPVADLAESSLILYNSLDFLLQSLSSWIAEGKKMESEAIIQTVFLVSLETSQVLPVVAREGVPLGLR